MPLTIRFIEGSPLVLIQLEGPCTGSAVARTIHSITHDSRLPLGASLLWDARRLTSLHISHEDVDAVVAAANALERATGAGRTAVVAVRFEDDVTARLFARVIGSERREIRVFTTMEEALAWLGFEDVTL